jgi:hypothetical protein
MLVGTWREDYSEGDLRMMNEKTFLGDGSAVGWIKIWRRGPDGKEALVGDVTFKSRWKIEGQNLVSYEVRTKPEGMLDPKKEIRDEILSIDGDVFRFKTDDGKIGVTKKQPNQSLQPTAATGRG